MYAAPHASAIAGGSSMAGAFIRNVQTRLTSPAAGATNTGTTVTLQAVALDPFRRGLAVEFALDRPGTFGSPDVQTSSDVAGTGWADTPISWASAAFDNGLWVYRARSKLVKIGSGPNLPAGRWAKPVEFIQAGGAGLPRSLYLYVNKGIEALLVESRSLYLYVNRGFTASVAARSLYLYLSAKDGEVFPYLNHLSPPEQYEGGQVSLYGDGFGQYLDATQSATLTVSSTYSSNIAAFIRDGTAAEWKSTSGASAWIRFTWGAAKKIVAVVLEGGLADPWGVPRFGFDDASSQDGASAIVVSEAYARDAQYPIGGQRTLYWLATPKTTTYVEIAIASGGSGTNRGLAEAWILEEISPAQDAEGSSAILNRLLVTELAMGIVSWQTRSANWHPANSGVAPGAAAVVTVPTGAVSGLVTVEETT